MNDHAKPVSLAVEFSDEQAHALGFFLQHLPLPHIDTIARTEREAAAMVDAASALMDALSLAGYIKA